MTSYILIIADFNKNLDFGGGVKNGTANTANIYFAGRHAEKRWKRCAKNKHNGR